MTRIDPRELLDRLLARRGLVLGDLRSGNKSARFTSRARQEAAAWLRELGWLTWREIGQMMGDSEHSTSKCAAKAFWRDFPKEQ